MPLSRGSVHRLVPFTVSGKGIDEAVQILESLANAQMNLGNNCTSKFVEISK